MAFVQYRPDTPEGRDAQLQAIAIITAGLDSVPLAQLESRLAAAKAKAEGCLALGPMQLPDPIGYVCFIKDPDGYWIEIVEPARLKTLGMARDEWTASAS